VSVTDVILYMIMRTYYSVTTLVAIVHRSQSLKIKCLTYVQHVDPKYC